MIKYTNKQQEAINTLDQNLQIIACAGSGKTQVISQRVIEILRNKETIEPKHILAFTYTEKSAAELKERILRLCREELGDIQGLGEMFVGTIHAWCLNTLRDNIYDYQKFSVLDEIKLKLFIDKNFNQIGMTDLNMQMYKDTGHFVGLMTILRESTFKDPENIPDELTTALNKYESTLQNASFFDFTMIMTKMLKHLKDDKNFKKKLHDQLKFIIVDEYQDINPIQEAIISTIYNKKNNICVVGDDDQTIYQWRGSDINNIITFQDRYDDVSVVRMEDNFRSSSAITESSHIVIQENELRLDKKMISKNMQSYEKGDILINSLNNVDEENQFIVDTIRKVRGLSFNDKTETRGLDYSDIVILLRRWKKAEAICEALKDANIPFIVDGIAQLFTTREISAAQSIFQYLNKSLDKEFLKLAWVQVSDKIKIEDLDEAIEYLDVKSPENVTFYNDFCLQDIYWTFLEKAKITEESFIDKKGDMIVGNRSEEIIYYNLGMFSGVIDDFENINYKLQPSTKLRRFLQFLTFAAQNYYSEGWLSNKYWTPNAVQVMTIFQSKGLEYPVVFVPGLNKNYLPSQRFGGKSVWHYIDKNLIQDQHRYETSLEDERRLFYVAITRSKKFLFLTRAPDGRNEQNESQFSIDIKHSPYVFSAIDRNYDDREFEEPRPRSDKENISLNFSVLKNFYDCPYRFKLVSMYGFCFPISMRMGYGKSIHDALMEMHRRSLDGEEISLALVDPLLDTHFFLPHAYEKVIQDMRNKAEFSISEYFRRNEDSFKEIEFAEKDIQIDLGEGILVSGRIDLIKKKNLDGSYQTTIIDFKSTDDAQTHEVSFEQLSLYALGYNELTGENADFLQIYNLDTNNPNTQELTQEHLDNTKSLIVGAANHIRLNNFEKTKESKKCESCWQIQICSGSKNKK